ncbi:MAG: hypothetical protein DSY86_03480, partial [Marinomonas sp.]
GRKMSKSEGNTIAPQKIVKNLGADIIRLWVAATDYTTEMHVSDEILKRTADTYRRLRNTARFLLSNLAGFEPETNSVAPNEMLALDRWAVRRAIQLQDELIELQKSLKKTIVFVSHDLDEALKIGSKIAIMESARIIQEDVPEQIVLNPATEYVEKFVAHTNPLNVLRGNALMTPVAQLGKMDNLYKLTDHLWADLQDGKLESAKLHGEPVAIARWEHGMDIADLPEDSVVVAPVDISMRDAVEIRYQTKLSILLEENGKCVGVLSDHDFYHALLGKHFSRAS